MDEVTGLSRKVIVEFKGGDLRPRVSIKDSKGKTAKLAGTNSVARYLLSVGINIVVSEGDKVRAGDIHGEDSPRNNKNEGYHRRFAASRRII